MGMAQFAKVVLLPQGDFAAFLRATPEDRREVLERLFDISAFSDVEAWLAEARRTAGADLEAARSTLEALLVRVEDVLADAHDAAGDPVTATAEVPPESVGTHLRAVAERLDARVSTTMAAFDTASGAERAAAEALAAARALDDLRTRGQRAVARLETLEASRPSHVERVATLAAAERAAGLRGHLTALDRAVDDVTACRRQVERTREALPTGPLPDTARRTRWPRCSPGCTPSTTPSPRSLARPTTRRCEPASTPSSTTAPPGSRPSPSAWGPRSPTRRPSARCSPPRSRRGPPGAGRVPELELVLRATRDRVTVLDAAEHDLARAEALAPRHADLRGTALDRRSELLDLRQRRLDGMAAELARALSEGDPCPVCGGLEHPTPATVSDPVLPDDIAEAEHRLDGRRGAAALGRGRDRVAAHPGRHPARRPRRRRPRRPRPGGVRGHRRAGGRSRRRRCTGRARGPARGRQPSRAGAPHRRRRHRGAPRGRHGRPRRPGRRRGGRARPHPGPERRARRLPLRLPRPGGAPEGCPVAHRPRRRRHRARWCRGPAGLGDRRPRRSPRDRRVRRRRLRPRGPARPHRAGSAARRRHGPRRGHRSGPSRRRRPRGRRGPGRRPARPRRHCRPSTGRPARRCSPRRPPRTTPPERCAPSSDSCRWSTRPAPGSRSAPSATPGSASSPTPRAASAPTTPCGCG